MTCRVSPYAERGTYKLKLGNCTNPLKFSIDVASKENIASRKDFRVDPDDPYKPLYLIVNGTLCAASKRESRLELKPCRDTDELETGLAVLSRQFISWERKGLTLPLPDNTSSCHFQGCGLNNQVR